MKITAYVSLALVLGGAASAKAAPLPTADAGGPLQDQSAAGGTAGDPPAAPASSPASAQQSAALQEVVITAEKRTTNLQQTPIAATVLTGSQLLHNGVITVD